MATSGVTTGEMTAGEVVREAYELRGAVSLEADISGSQMTSGLRRLNWMLKGWQSKGFDLWRLTDEVITWPADTATAELDGNWLDALDVRYVGESYERTLTRLERTDGNELPNKTTTGFPSAYVAWRQRDKLWMRVWPVPDEEVEFRADLVRIVEDVTDPAQTLDIQQEWTEAVFYNLATRLTGGDPKLVPMIEARARDLYDKLPTFDTSGSVFLIPGGVAYSW